MRYYVMESQNNILLPTASKGESAEVILAPDLNRFNEIDFDARSELISERLKLLMEMYMPKHIFEPVVYLDNSKDEQMIFWRFRPPIYTDCQADFKSNGMVSHISFSDDRAPIVFTVRSPKGIRSIIVRMAVAESTLRRCILGVSFNRITDD